MTITAHSILSIFYLQQCQQAAWVEDGSGQTVGEDTDHPEHVSRQSGGGLSGATHGHTQC